MSSGQPGVAEAVSKISNPSPTGASTLKTLLFWFLRYLIYISGCCTIKRDEQERALFWSGCHLIQFLHTSTRDSGSPHAQEGSTVDSTVLFSTTACGLFWFAVWCRQRTVDLIRERMVFLSFQHASHHMFVHVLTSHADRGAQSREENEGSRCTSNQKQTSMIS